MPTPIRIGEGIEGHITTHMFHDVTQGRVSEERLAELLESGTIRSFVIRRTIIIDVASVREWLRSVHSIILMPIKREPMKDLFA